MEEKEGDLQTYLNIVLKHKYLIGIILSVFILAAIVIYVYSVPHYTAQTTLIIEKETLEDFGFDIDFQPNPSSIRSWAYDNEFIMNLVEQMEITKLPLKRDMVQRVTSFDFSSVEYLNDKQMASYISRNIKLSITRDVIELSVTTQYPKLSAEIANSIAGHITQKARDAKQEKIQNTINLLDTQIEAVQKILDEKEKERSLLMSPNSDYNKIRAYQLTLEEQQKTLSNLESEFANLIYQRDNEVRTGLEDIKLNIQIRSVNESINRLGPLIEKNKKEMYSLDTSVLERVNEIRYEIKRNQESLYALLSDKQKIVLVSVMNPSGISVLKEANVPGQDTTKLLAQFFMLIFFGAAFSGGLVFLLEMWDRRFFASLEDVEDTLGHKVIGSLPVLTESEKFELLDPKQNPEVTLVEAYRTLATNIKFATKGKKVKSIMFTSDKPSTGKSMTVANLGIVMGTSKHKVLIVDVDLRRPRLHSIFNVPRKPGFTDVLAGDIDLKDALVKINKSVTFLPAGKLNYNPESVLESKEIKKMVKKFAKSYDFVFYDSIPLTTFSDVDILSTLTDSSILVMDAEKSDRKSMKFSKKRLEEIESHILGVVVNRAERRFSPYFRSYYYYKKYKSTGEDLTEWEAELMKYMIDAISKGRKPEHIKKELLEKKWPEKIIDERLKEVIKSTRE